ncbi:hypothetical protein Agub_g8647 [Astrephomene gubernaculifera]|uniref:MYND-type domain-containing protein n=1 Tax=Astrephomene gubernaculifera TaxID=47775 RepID=A0AAD3DSC3_9CHLO|nr:hypothetical protein Agub_g8647 [Astrephomene gubernaculifera]
MSATASADKAEGAAKNGGASESSGGPPAKTCCVCGASPAPGKRLQRCTGCLSALYCSPACQRAAWPEHKPECSRCKKFDVHAASPLFAALAFLPRMATENPMLRYEVIKKELRGRELHMYMGNKIGRQRMMPEFDMSGSGIGPSRQQLHHMVQSDGQLEAAVVGTMYGFHVAVQEYNNRRLWKGSRTATSSDPAPPQDYVALVHGAAKITEYGIAIGSTNPDYSLVYHLDNNKEVVQLQDPRNHVWVYFSTERACRLFLDVGSLPYGMGLMLNVIPYLPEATPETYLKFATPSLGAPAAVMDRYDTLPVPPGGRLQPGHAVAVARQAGYLADRKRIPVSSLPVSKRDPEGAIRSLLTQLREAAEPPPAPTAPSAAAAAAAVPPLPAKAAAAAAAAVALTPPTLAAAVVAAAAESTVEAAAAAIASTSKAPRVPFRDGPMEDVVRQALPYFECAFNNTYAVLEQGTYKRYPATLDGSRCFAPWVDLSGLDRRQPPPDVNISGPAGRRKASGRSGKS